MTYIYGSHVICLTYRNNYIVLTRMYSASPERLGESYHTQVILGLQNQIQFFLIKFYQFELYN